MLRSKNQTPPRKHSKESIPYDERYKYSTVESRCSKDCKALRQSQHWTNHEKRRESRINSLLKARKVKLEEITGENKKIFIRINQQQPHYPSIDPHQHKAAIKYCSPPKKELGPIANWQPPSCFIAGSRGIMCQQNFGLEDFTTKPKNERFPSLPKIATPDRQKQNKREDSCQLKLGLLYFTPNRSRRLSDLYMLI